MLKYHLYRTHRFCQFFQLPTITTHSLHDITLQQNTIICAKKKRNKNHTFCQLFQFKCSLIRVHMLLQYTYINYTVNVIVKLNSFDIQKFVNTQFKMLWNYIQKKKKKEHNK